MGSFLEFSDGLDRIKQTAVFLETDLLEQVRSYKEQSGANSFSYACNELIKLGLIKAKEQSQGYHQEQMRNSWVDAREDDTPEGKEDYIFNVDVMGDGLGGITLTVTDTYKRIDGNEKICGEWIDVNDRLPEIEESVVVLGNFGYDIAEMLDTGEWEGLWHDLSKNVVIYWMRLPEVKTEDDCKYKPLEVSNNG
jgi:hypothetical protein